MRPCSGGRNMSSLLPDLDALWYGDRFAMLNHGVCGERSFTVLFHHLIYSLLLFKSAVHGLFMLCSHFHIPYILTVLLSCQCHIGDIDHSPGHAQRMLTRPNSP